MFLLIPSASNARYLYPGKVIQSNSATFSAQFEDPISPQIASDVTALCEVNGKFFQEGAVVLDVVKGLENCFAFARSGEIVSAESRQTYRVSVAANDDVTLVVGRDASCPVLDVSPEGFAAVTAKQLNLGSVVPITLIGDVHTVHGTARIQTVRERRDGKFRYGFLVPRNDLQARKALQQLSAAMQRRQLKRIRGAA